MASITEAELAPCWAITEYCCVLTLVTPGSFRSTAAARSITRRCQHHRFPFCCPNRTRQLTNHRSDDTVDAPSITTVLCFQYLLVYRLRQNSSTFFSAGYRASRRQPKLLCGMRLFPVRISVIIFMVSHHIGDRAAFPAPKQIIVDFLREQADNQPRFCF